MLLSSLSLAVMLDPLEERFNGNTREQLYDHLIDQFYAQENVLQVVDNKLWVPWYDTSTSCNIDDLHDGNKCGGGSVDFNRNCMVTDEFSQMGILIAMGDDQNRMNQFYNTLGDIESTFGKIPAWRIYRDGSSIEACKDGVNGNCDTASDATARIIIALFIASENELFTDSSMKAQYNQLARELSDDMVEFEVREECKPSDLGYGDICYWLAAGSQAKRGGMASTDFGYSGYYGDAIIAMLLACGQTGDEKYCEIAEDFSLNYLQAAKWDGQSFTVPPGRSFKWTNLDGIPQAECTNTCSPAMWDDADAPRAMGMCQAIYYAEQVGAELPALESYCNLWGEKYLNIPYGAPLQYYPDGSIAVWYQSGYYAQGLQALFQAGGPNPELFETTLDSALKHYDTKRKVWDYDEQCMGVYTHAFPVRALGFGIGRDEAAFKNLEGGWKTFEPVKVVEQVKVAGSDNNVPAQEPVVEEDVYTFEKDYDHTLHLWIKPPYPKERQYVFICDAKGMEPTSYDWFFDNGEKLLHVDNRDVFHEFDGPGTYRVRCVARDDSTTWATTAEIKVN